MDYNNMQHVHPMDDTGAHLFEIIIKEDAPPVCLCPCQPMYINLDNGGLIIQHNAFDGREVTEWVNEILSQ